MYPIHYGCIFGNIEFVTNLLNLGSDINSINYHGKSCYDLAIEHNHDELATFIKTLPNFNHNLINTHSTKEQQNDSSKEESNE